MWPLILAAQIAVGPIDSVPLVKSPTVAKTVQSTATLGPTQDIAADASGPMRIALDLDQSVLQNPATKITLELWVFNGIYYVLDTSAVYIGGIYKDKNGKAITDPPGFWLDAKQYAGKKIRVRVVPMAGPVAAGATLELKQ